MALKLVLGVVAPKRGAYFSMAPQDTPTLGSWTLRCLQLQSASPVRNLAARPRRAVSETTFDGTLISSMSFETLAFEDLSATRLTATSAVKRTFSNTHTSQLGRGYRGDLRRAKVWKRPRLHSVLVMRVCRSLDGSAGGFSVRRRAKT